MEATRLPGDICCIRGGYPHRRCSLLYRRRLHLQCEHVGGRYECFYLMLKNLVSVDKYYTIYIRIYITNNKKYNLGIC